MSLSMMDPRLIRYRFCSSTFFNHKGFNKGYDGNSETEMARVVLYPYYESL